VARHLEAQADKLRARAAAEMAEPMQIKAHPTDADRVHA
jgi:hypothetical protein